MMNLMMPLFFGWITLTLPSGLGLYYVLSNIIGMVMQYAYVGGGPINWRAMVGLSQEPVLPRAIQQREAQRERYSQPASFDEDDEDEEEASESGVAVKPKAPRSGSDQATNGGGGKRRRRRYGRGKR